MSASMTELVLYSVTVLATLVGMIQIQRLRSATRRDMLVCGGGGVDIVTQ